MLSVFVCGLLLLLVVGCYVCDVHGCPCLWLLMVVGDCCLLPLVVVGWLLFAVVVVSLLLGVIGRCACAFCCVVECFSLLCS